MWLTDSLNEPVVLYHPGRPDFYWPNEILLRNDWSQGNPDRIRRARVLWVMLELLLLGVTKSGFPWGKRSPWMEGNLYQGQASRTSSLGSMKTEEKKA